MPTLQRTIVVLLFLAFGGAAGIGCEEREPISIDRRPKDPPPVAAPVQPVADAATAAGQAKTILHWDAPPDWKELPAQQMRYAAFRVNENPNVDLTVIPLGPEAGALLPNVNRWEGQLGLAPSAEAELAKLVTKSQVNGLDVQRVDLAGTKERILAAIVPHAGKIWFFKIQGPSEIVAKQKEKFDAFIGSLHAAEEGHKHGGDAAAGAGEHAGHDHAGHDHAAPAGPISKITKFTAPDGWREVGKSEPPRMLTLQSGDGDKQVEMAATRFAAGQTGSFADNVNRWRQQLGLPPIDDPRTVPMKDATVGKDGEGILLEMHNPQNQKRMLMVIASARGDMWFFKLTGAADAVDAERAKFDTLIRSLEFGADDAAKK